ncbi:MAG TPA: ATP-grasp domain-containing protein, partial [Clostridiaceae bacterium]|nr:ATP-grasp domain-containing protein [Clostridiaceae bacterium]
GLGIRFDCVGCFSYGNALVTQNRISHYFDLPNKIPRQAEALCSDKSFLRDQLRKKGLSVLQELSLSELLSGKQLPREKTYIIKPKCGGSSRGISKVSAERIQDLVQNGKIHHEVIIQEFAAGTEYRVSALIQNSAIKFLGLMRKENLDGTFLTGRLQPVYDYPEWASGMVTKIVSAFHLDDAIMKIDLIKTSNAIEILEIDFGIAGDYFETYICPLCYGIDFIELYLDFILGMAVNPLPKEPLYHCFDYIYNLTEKTCSVNYNRISTFFEEYLGGARIVEIKQDGEPASFPSSNMDAVCGILHNRTDISNHRINKAVGELLADGACQE